MAYEDGNLGFRTPSPEWLPASFSNPPEPHVNDDPDPATPCLDRIPTFIGQSLPFNLTRATGTLPLTTQTLKELTGRLLLARQIGRLSDFHSLWQLEPRPSNANSFFIKFDGQLVEGLELFEFEPEANVNKDYKICGFGCTKGGIHQHLSNVWYSHFSRLTPAPNAIIKAHHGAGT
jgi:hypothetical protein